MEEDPSVALEAGCGYSSGCDEFPTCAMCMEKLGTNGGPASLPCGHNGCLECLQKVQLLSALPLCPLCRTPFDTELNLGLNFDLRDALDHIKLMNAGTEGTSEDNRNDGGDVFFSPPLMEATGPWIPVSRKEGADEVCVPGKEICTEVERHGELPETCFWNIVNGMLSIVFKKERPQVYMNSVQGRTQGHHVYKDFERHVSDLSSVHLDTSEPGKRTAERLGPVVQVPSVPYLAVPAAVDVRATRSILEADPPQWMPDSSASACMQCGAIFRPLTRGRHHCRFCGGIICWMCSSGRCLLPVKFREPNPQRVCDTCYELLEPVQRNLLDRVSNAVQLATHDVTDLTCMRAWLNNPVGISMEQEIYKATNIVRDYCKLGKLKPDKFIPDAVLQGAKGLAILTVVKAGVMVTYKIGTGLVVARRRDGTWSAPSAIFSCGIGWGAQVGGELTDFILVLRSKRAVRAFCRQFHVSFGAGLSAAAGPLGRAAEADIRAALGAVATCYTYSRSKGAFLGVSFEGNVVKTQTATNQCFYGDAYIKTSDILLGSVKRPRAALPLYDALYDLCKKVDAPQFTEDLYFGF